MINWAVKTGYPLTSITCPYLEVEYFLKLSADAGSSLFTRMEDFVSYGTTLARASCARGAPLQTYAFTDGTQERYLYIKERFSATLDVAETQIGPKYMKIPFSIVQAQTEELNAYFCFQTSRQTQPIISHLFGVCFCLKCFIFYLMFIVLMVNHLFPQQFFFLGRQTITL